jgi:hypothetical protein
LHVFLCQFGSGVDFVNGTLIPAITFGGETMNQFLRLLFGLGLAFTEPRQRHRIYDRVTDKLDDVADQASRGYDAVADRVERLYHEARGENDHLMAGATSFLIGMGVGVGAGLLFAPASGRETREAIAEKARAFRSDVRRAERKTA